MASISSLSLHAIAQLPSRHSPPASLSSSSSSSSASSSSSNRGFGRYRLPHLLVRKNGSMANRTSVSAIAGLVAAAEAQKFTEVPTVAATKRAFLDAYRRPVPSIYSTVVQELLVQQHLMRYNATYQYDAIFGLGFVTVFDQLFDGFPSSADRDLIFQAYIGALQEEPERYRSDAKKLEEWGKQQSASSVVSFGERDGEVEALLKDIAERAGGKGNFHYSRFFAIGLFRLLELAKASDPAILEQLAKAVNVNKLSIDRDLDIYRNLLSKLAQAKDLLKEYLDREKRKQAEREAEKAAAASKIEVTTDAKSE
ncbi:unnamed protein product [Calypogeia fissa]